MEWLDIETAPKDGFEILVYCPAHGSLEPYYAVAFWSRKHNEWRSSVGCKMMTSEPATLVPPTHWMKLPEDPDYRTLEEEIDDAYYHALEKDD